MLSGDLSHQEKRELARVLAAGIEIDPDYPTNIYKFIVIRYSPDPFIGEVANIGVLFWSPKTKKIEKRIIEDHERLKTFFGKHFDPEKFKGLIEYLNQTLDIVIEEANKEKKLTFSFLDTQFRDYVYQELQLDEASCFQFSRMMSILGTVFDDAFKHVYKQFIER